VRLSVYTPSTFGVKVGLAAVESDSVALTEFEMNDQLYVRASPSSSELPLPSSVTREPVVTL
jgi:hypothetical protein